MQIGMIFGMLSSMNKYENLKAALERGETPSMKCAGNSMLPILSNPSTCTYRKQETYAIGDIVFCRVKGRYIDAHKITAIQGERYLISNNHGHDNGWTKTIYGRVISASSSDGRQKTF
ncbi:S24 family peptidase [Rhizobium sp. MHM7A]|uniref:S24 family peptidase n=1 Tax=Rhizobium sp. MHM7A TaxID=2583233 RepID=UPI00198066A8|nr:S24 family peptidase [Rhizobium sp. MHM7A]